jgi:sigma-B regulation protein RsbQ
MEKSILKRNNVNVQGRGDRTLIFAHGFGTDQTAWRHIVPAFESDYRIVLFDYIGAGKSDFTVYSQSRYSSLYGYADDLVDLCAELRLTNSILVGHSVSAMVGLLASLMEPKCFSHLIFIGASPRYLNDVNYHGGFEQSDLDAIYTAMSTNYEAWAGGFFAPLMMGNPERPNLAREYASTLTAVRPDIAVALARAIFQSDFRAHLLRLTVPTLVIQASDDKAVPPEVGRYIASKIPYSQLVNIEARGHLPHLSAPDEVIRAIKAYLARE